MDWEGLRERTLGEVANTLVAEGVGVGAGFIGASTIGRRVEDYMIPTPIISTDPFMTKMKGWAYNNVPKLAIWYMIRKYIPETPETKTQEMMMDAKKAIAGSIVFDSLLRVTNHGVPLKDMGGYKLLGGKGEDVRTAAPAADTQRLIQENSALRTELNKALQRLAAPAPVAQPVQVAAPQSVQVASPQVSALQADVQRLIQENSAMRSEMNSAVQRLSASAPQAVHVAAPVQPVQVQVQAPQPVQVRQVAQAPPVVNVAPIQAAPAAPVVRYQPAPAPAPARMAPPVVRVEQQQAVPPAIAERERRFAFMPTYNAPPEVQEREKKYGFAGKASEKEIATMFGML